MLTESQCIALEKKYMEQQAYKYENLLDRNFVADKPNAKLVTDIY